MSTLKSIAVFSGSSTGNDIRFQKAAAKLGCLIGERKIRFIYGGGGLGLMGIAARHAKERGSYVIGILPELMNTPDVTEGNVESELLVVPEFGRIEPEGLQIDRIDPLSVGYHAVRILDPRPYLQRL